MRIYSKIGIIQTTLLILLLYILFIIYIAFIRFNIYSDLISDHYYEEEILYQKIIDYKNNVKQLRKNIILKLDKSGIIVRFPKPFNYDNITGELFLIRFSDKTNDIYQRIQLNNKNEHFIFAKKLKSGLYKLQLKWIYNKKISYFIEKTIKWKN